METTVEHERKLEAEPGWDLPDLGGEALEPRVFTSVYHDTSDGSLAHAGITLRRRTERGKSVWQLKLPLSGARVELEQPGGMSVPEQFATLLAAHLRNGPLGPVAELRTRRHGVLVQRNGTTAEATVDEVSVMDSLRVTSEFVEVEVELKDGNPRRLDDIAKELRKAGAQPSDERPKVFRALGIANEQLPADAFERLRALLRKQLNELLGHDPGTRLGLDPESLHNMRVAVRRARALLRTGAPLIATDTQMLALELKWLGEILGDVRDLDVLIERLRAEADELDAPDASAARRLIRRLKLRHTRARKTLLRALDGRRYLNLLDRFANTVDELQPTRVALALDDIARGELKKLRKAVAETDDNAPDESLHAVRKRGKNARYAAELAGRNGVVKRAKKLQDVLGEHQDAVVAQATLRALAKDVSSDQAIAAGRLIDAESARREQARARWRKAADAV